MSLNDPISDLLTVIRNGLMVRKETVDVPATKLSAEILEIFKQDGYIENFRLMKDNVQGTIKVYLKYSTKDIIVRGIRRISKPGLRVYAKHDKIPRVLNGLGMAVLSTSKGVMNDREARKMKIGGEVLCYIW